jgi:hypothetical protein
MGDHGAGALGLKWGPTLATGLTDLVDDLAMPGGERAGEDSD